MIMESRADALIAIISSVIALQKNERFYRRRRIVVKKTLYFVYLILMSFSTSAFGQGWLGKILPIQSKVSDLPGVFNSSPEKRYEDHVLYRLDEGNVLIWFSLGRCSQGSWGSWDAEEGAILAIDFYPKKRLRPSAYRFAGSNTTLLNQTISDDKIGVLYTTQFGKVTRIHYYPALQFNTLKCST